MIFFQRNVAGSSQAMEYFGFQKCMQFLFANGLNVITFISDRHTSKRKHMKEQLPNITHYFDFGI